ncbi:SGNH/GDSL hydrolase family protein [bacterium]|nr:SGNH/GDSL hydrolase family protein [bacterium]
MKDESTRPRRRRWLLRALVFSGSIVFSLALGEVIVRVVHPGPINPFEPGYEHDEWGTRRPSPGFRSEDGRVAINSLGFRDSEDFQEKKPEGETRVLFLGDSFLYAARLDERDVLPKQSERLLAARTGRRVRAINSGCPAYGTNHEREILEHHGLALSPDLVVLCFFVGNDVTDVLTTAGVWADEGHVLHLEKREDSRWKRALACSKLYQRISATELYQRLAHRKLAETARVRSGFVPLAQQMYEAVEATRLEQWQRGASDRPPLDEGWRAIEENLRGIVETSRRARAPLVVLVIPDEIQVDASLRTRIVEALKLDLADYDLEQPQRKVAELCRALDVPCVDVLDAFRERARSERVYLELDTHWNARGHELAAGLLEPVLEGLLARKP